MLPPRLLPWCIVVPLVVLVASSCGSDLTRSQADEAFQLQYPESSANQAGCVVDALIESFGLEGLQGELETEEPTESFRGEQFRAMFGCGMTDRVESEVARQLLARDDADLDEDQAACVAAELTADLDDTGLSVLISGEITPDFFGVYFEAVEACAALP